MEVSRYRIEYVLREITQPSGRNVRAPGYRWEWYLQYDWWKLSLVGIERIFYARNPLTALECGGTCLPWMGMCESSDAVRSSSISNPVIIIVHPIIASLAWDHLRWRWCQSALTKRTQVETDSQHTRQPELYHSSNLPLQVQSPDIRSRSVALRFWNLEARF